MAAMLRARVIRCASRRLASARVRGRVCCTSRWHLIWFASVAAWKDVAVPEPYPDEFRDDAVRVARDGEPGVRIEQIARVFGVHPVTLQKWLRNADIEDGAKPGQARAEGAELREACNRFRAAGAGERGPTAGGGVSVASTSAGKGSTRS